MTHTLSVAMCTYNGSRHLSEQLESIGTQTRLPDELVICDDCSSDDTIRIIERFSASAPFAVRLEINTQNLGSTKNFEKAIRLCQGDLIALADQDDVWLSVQTGNPRGTISASAQMWVSFFLMPSWLTKTCARLVHVSGHPSGSTTTCATG